MRKNARKLKARTTLRLVLLNNGMELPYLLLAWRLRRGLRSRRGSAASEEEEDRSLLRAVVLPLPVISGRSAINGVT